MKLKFFLFIALFQSVVGTAQNKALFVDGKNTVNGQGELTNPFQTIQAAVEAAKTGDTLFVREGVYREQVNLTKGDLTIQPFQDERVTINGTGALLSWTKTSGSIYQTSMNWNVTQSDQSNQIFCDGKMLELLRWPENTASTLLPSNGFADKVTEEGGNNVIYDADFKDPAGKWNGCEIWVNISRTIPGNGWDGQGWTGKIISSAPGKIVVSGKISNVIANEPYGLGPNTEYFLFNPTPASVKQSGGIEAYLKKGEWWKNGDSLFVSTFDGQEPASSITNSHLIEAKKRLYSFAFSGKQNITIKGFTTFACTINTDVQDFFNRTSSVGTSSNIVIDGIKAEYVTHFTNQAKNWQMQWVQRSGFIISGTNITLKNCEIQYSAGSGVSVFGRKNKILNNKIWDVNYSNAECGAMNTGLQYDPSLVISEDHEIAYNTIFNTPQQGINIRALVNSSKAKPGMARIHHNVIHDFMLKTHDSAAIDTYNTDGKWVRIDHNLVYNSTLMLAIGFYLDFGTNYLVDHNLFFNVERPIQLNEGGWDPNPTQYSDVWVFNNTAMADKLNKDGILNAAGPFPEGFKIMNNITSANLVERYPAPLVKNNFYPKNTAELNSFFTNQASQDYSLKTSNTLCIDTCEFAPFNDQIINKPDAGCFESGVEPWKAGYGNLTPQFVLSDNFFVLKTGHKTSNEWKIPVYALPYCGFSGEISLSLEEIPNGITASISVDVVKANESVELTVKVDDTLPLGIYVFKLVGVSGELTDTRYYSIEVQQVTTMVKITNPLGELKYNSSYKFAATAHDIVGTPMQYQPTITWTCKGGGTISKTGNYKAGSEPGAVTIYASVGAIVDSCSLKVVSPVSVNEMNSGKEGMQVSPNPASKQATVDFFYNEKATVFLSIYSNSGSKVKQEIIETKVGDNQYVINLENLLVGLYLLEIKGNKGKMQAKLLIVN